jgi:uncharacterized membrane protein
MASVHDGVGPAEIRRQVRRTLTPSPDRGINVGRTERWISGIAGVGLAALGLRRRRLRGLLFPVAGWLLDRAVTGRCAVNRILRRNSARPRDTVSRVASIARGEGIRVETSIEIDRPCHELYTFWRNFENLPRFMGHLESVQVIDQRRSHWVARGPAGSRVEWDAEVHHEIPNQLIAWRTLPGAEVDHAGSVHFEPRRAGRSTEVRVLLRYDPTAGLAGAAVAALFGEEPSQQIEDDLRRFKRVMEAGDVSPVPPKPLP